MSVETLSIQDLVAENEAAQAATDSVERKNSGLYNHILNGSTTGYPLVDLGILRDQKINVETVNQSLELSDHIQSSSGDLVAIRSWSGTVYGDDNRQFAQSYGYWIGRLSDADLTIDRERSAWSIPVSNRLFFENTFRNWSGGWGQKDEIIVRELWDIKDLYITELDEQDRIVPLLPGIMLGKRLITRGRQAGEHHVQQEQLAIGEQAIRAMNIPQLEVALKDLN